MSEQKPSVLVRDLERSRTGEDESPSKLGLSEWPTGWDRLGSNGCLSTERPHISRRLDVLAGLQSTSES